MNVATLCMVTFFPDLINRNQSHHLPIIFLRRHLQPMHLLMPVTPMAPVLNLGFRFQGLVSILMIGLVLTPALRPHVFCAINHTACGTVLVSEVWVQRTGSIQWNLTSCAIIACDHPTWLKLVVRNPCVLCRDVMVNTPCSNVDP